MRERHLRIQPQRLVKRSRRFDPHVVVEIGKTLVIEPLRLRVLRTSLVMDDADARAQRDLAFEQLLRDRRNRVERVLRRGRRRDKQEYEEKREAQGVYLKLPAACLLACWPVSLLAC